MHSTQRCIMGSHAMKDCYTDTKGACHKQLVNSDVVNWKIYHSHLSRKNTSVRKLIFMMSMKLHPESH